MSARRQRQMCIRDSLNPSLPILVVDSETNFIFKPLMYEVLSKEIRSWEASPKFANIFSDAGITFLRNSLTKISFKENILEFSDDLKLSYHYLVTVSYTHLTLPTSTHV